MDLSQPPLLNALWAAYIAVVATILIGIFFTKDDKRNFENIVSNIVSFALLLATVQFTWLTLLIMGMYLLVGIIVAIEKMRKWFFLFGSKTYGTLALMILLVAEESAWTYGNGNPIFGFTLAQISLPLTWKMVEYLGVLLLGWLVFALVAHTVGLWYWRTPEAKSSRSSGSDTSLKAMLGGWVSSKKGKRTRRTRGRSTSRRRSRKKGPRRK